MQPSVYEWVSLGLIIVWIIRFEWTNHVNERAFKVTAMNFKVIEGWINGDDIKGECDGGCKERKDDPKAE